MFITNFIILTLGFVTSYTDIRFRKIKNIHLSLAIVFGFFAYLCLIADSQMFFSMRLILNVFIGLGIGLLLYLTDAWGAGDAKLFAIYCFLLPVEKYSKILFFPSIAIFVNIFLVGTFGILAMSMNDIVRDRVRIFKTVFSMSTFAKLGLSFLIIFSLKWVIEIVLSSLIPQTTSFVSILVLFFADRVVRRVMVKYTNRYIFTLVLFLGIISRFFVFPLDFNIEKFFSYLKMVSIYALSFQLFSAILEKNKSSDEKTNTIPYAPLMFIGVLFVNTNFIYWIMQILRSIRK